MAGIINIKHCNSVWRWKAGIWILKWIDLETPWESVIIIKLKASTSDETPHIETHSWAESKARPQQSLQTENEKTKKKKEREKPAHYHWPAWAIKFKADNKTRAKLHIKLWPTMNREAVIPILFASFILRGSKSHRVSFFLSECLLHVLKGEMTSLIFAALCGPILSGRGRCVLWHSSAH